VIRTGYGWTDREIVAQIERFGDDWVIGAYKRILSDRAREMHWAINVAQAARSPMSKKSSKSLRNYVRKLHNNVNAMTPWDKNSKLERLKALRDKSKQVTGEKALKASEDLVRKLGIA